MEALREFGELVAVFALACLLTAGGCVRAHMHKGVGCGEARVQTTSQTK